MADILPPEIEERIEPPLEASGAPHPLEQTILFKKPWISAQNAYFAFAALTAFSVLLVLFFFGQTRYLASRNRFLSEKVKQMEARITTAGRENQSLTLRLREMTGLLESAKKDKETLALDLKKAEEAVNSIKEEKIYLEEMLINKTKEIGRLSSQVNSTEAAALIRAKDEDIVRLLEQNKLLAAKLDQIYRTTSERISAINVAKMALEQTIGEARKRLDDDWNSIDLGSIRVESASRNAAPLAVPKPREATPRRTPRKEGRIRAVNEEHGFVVVDLGRVDNVKNDATLQIIKEGKWLASLAVLEIRDVMTACTIKDAAPAYKIQINDPVTLQK